MNVLVDIQHAQDIVDEERVSALARFTLEQLELPESTEVSISFVNDDIMAGLNEEYRSKPGPTDVLSFECDNLDDGFPASDESDGVYALGDIVIAPDVAARQAQEYGNTANQEIDLLLVHGLLHLNGYDHIEDDDAMAMEGLQSKILDLWRNQSQQGGVV